jgi:hypothetical protein
MEWVDTPNHVMVAHLIDFMLDMCRLLVDLDDSDA